METIQECRMQKEGCCPRQLEDVSSFLSKKWTISIIITIGNFKCIRFNDLLSRLNGPTAKTLSDRLRELEKEGILIRRAYNEIPPRVEYSLSENGIYLLNALSPLMKWAEGRVE